MPEWAAHIRVVPDERLLTAGRAVCQVLREREEARGLEDREANDVGLRAKDA